MDKILRIGTRVKSKIAFNSVAVGTVGIVIEDYGTGFTIAWDLPNRPIPKDKTPEEIAAMKSLDPECPLRDGFSFDELSMLEIIEEKNNGKTLHI